MILPRFTQPEAIWKVSVQSPFGRKRSGRIVEDDILEICHRLTPTIKDETLRDLGKRKVLEMQGGVGGKMKKKKKKEVNIGEKEDIAIEGGCWRRNTRKRSIK